MELRPAYKEKSISSINEKDINLAISGMVVNSDINSFVLDDGTGQVAIFKEDSNLENGKYIRVLGKLMSFGEGIELQGDIIQDLNKINKQLHKKVIKHLEG